MTIDDNLLEKLEKLSSLEIKKEDRENTKKQLNDIVSFVEILDEINLSSQKATFTTLKGGTALREDEPKLNTEVIEIIMKNAPKSENNFFVVPKIIE